MKTKLARALLVLFAMSLFGAMSMSIASDYSDGYEDGYDKGKSDGLSQGDSGSGTSSGCCGSTNNSSS